MSAYFLGHHQNPFVSWFDFPLTFASGRQILANQNAKNNIYYNQIQKISGYGLKISQSKYATANR